MTLLVVRSKRPVVGALLSGSFILFASPAFAACDVVGADPDFAYYACSSENVRIKLTGPSASVGLSDFLLQPTGSEGYVTVFAADTESDPTDIIVELSGDSQIYALNYDGFDVRTVRGDILLDIREGTLVDADQTGLFVRSSDDDASGTYRGGDVVVNNYGMILSGPQTEPMGANGISALANGGAAQVNNYGTVIVRLETLGITDGRGIVADGGHSASEAVQVGIYNSGTVDALHDGLRVNSYNGLGKVVNDVGGNVTSRDRRGVVVWSQKGAAEFENYGTITALDGPGAVVWAEGNTNGYAKVINGGTILSKDNPDQDATDTFFHGVHIWSEVSGDAELDNLASGRIIAENGTAVFMQSTDGSVVIDNAGLLKGQGTAIRVTADDLNEIAGLSGEDEIADYLGARNGDISVTNSGTITAFGSAGSAANEALISLAGSALDKTTLTNLAGGFIGAGFADGTDFSLESLAQRSASGLEDIRAAARNKAVSLAVDGTGSTITNQGTLVGGVLVASPFDVYGATAPGSLVGGTIDNQGLWVASASSGFLASMTGTVANSGTIFTLGQTTFGGTFENAGAIWVSPTESQAAALSFQGAYEGSGSASLVFNLKSGAAMEDVPIVTFAEAVSGNTNVALADLGAWDWATEDALDLIDADATTELGAASFTLADPVHGLVRYALAYDEDEQVWSLGGTVDETSVTETASITSAVTGTLADLTSDLLTRTDDLRDIAVDPGDITPNGYAAVPSSPVDAAFEALTPPPGPQVRGWVKADGALGGGDGFSGRKASISLGGDITAEYDAVLYAAGLFGTLSTSATSYDASGSAAGVGAQALGAYGLVMHEGGLFASGVVAVQTADIDMQISGESAKFGALSGTGRVDVGYRSEVGGLVVEPSLGYRLGRTDYGDFTLSNRLVSIADAGNSAVEGRLRIQGKLATETLDIAPFAILAFGRNFASGGEVSLSDVGNVGTAAQGGLYGSVAAGVEVSSPDDKTSGFARADFNLSEQSRWGALKVGGSNRF